MDISFTAEEALKRLSKYYELNERDQHQFYTGVRHQLLSPIGGAGGDVENTIVLLNNQAKSLDQIVEGIVAYTQSVDMILHKLRRKDLDLDALEEYKASLVRLSNILPQLVSIQGDEKVERRMASAQSFCAQAVFVAQRLFGIPSEKYYLKRDVSIFETFHYHSFQKQGIMLITSLSMELETSADYLTEVIAPLVYNARDHAFQEKSKARITLICPTDETYFYVRVQDNGNGIPAEYHKRIFEQGFTTRTETEGHGIGLWAAKQYAENHGASLELETSEPGKTVFVLKIPYRKTDIGLLVQR